MKKVFILGACRTPIGKMGGILSRISAVELASIVIKESVRRADIASECVDHVYMGCVLQAGLGQNIARQASLKAGLPYTVTAETLNAVCGSGLDSVNMAARMIQAGDADVVVAGGTESMSQAPFAMMQGRFGYRMGSPAYQSPLVDTMIKDALWDSISDCHMGMTAENVADQWNISREEMDEFAVHSQEKTQKAIRRGDFADEIVSIEVEGKAGKRKVDTDEGPRPGTSMEKLGILKPVFKEGGKITAGNASGISDGAAAVVLIGEDKVREWNLIPMAEWLGGALGGVPPEVMGIGPVVSTRKLLKKLNMTLQDIDLIEGNEAFAAQSLAVARELGIPEEKQNVNGGAIALGHPVGASGCRILVTLLYAMKKRNAQTGLAMLCIGGGMGCSTAVRLA